MSAPQPPQSQSPNQPQTVDLNSLPLQTLSQLKSQLDDELQHLSTSYQKLRAAQQKFRECLGNIDKGLSGGVSEGKQILVPLTTSLYVPGTIADTSTVIVDVGTGFYVEKSTEDAKAFYTSKVEDLGTNLTDLEKILQGKTNNLRVIEEVLRQKMLSAQSSQKPTAVGS